MIVDELDFNEKVVTCLKSKLLSESEINAKYGVRYA